MWRYALGRVKNVRGTSPQTRDQLDYYSHWRSQDRDGRGLAWISALTYPRPNPGMTRYWSWWIMWPRWWSWGQPTIRLWWWTLLDSLLTRWYGLMGYPGWLCAIGTPDLMVTFGERCIGWWIRPWPCLQVSKPSQTVKLREPTGKSKRCSEPM